MPPIVSCHPCAAPMLVLAWRVTWWACEGDRGELGAGSPLQPGGAGAKKCALDKRSVAR